MLPAARAVRASRVTVLPGSPVGHGSRRAPDRRAAHGRPPCVAIDRAREATACRPMSSPMTRCWPRSSRERPGSIAGMRRVKGMGPARLDRYGEELIGILARHRADEGALTERPRERTLGASPRARRACRPARARGSPVADLSTVFTGIQFENPFLLASAPPTETESNIHAGLRGRLGRRRHEDDRAASRRQRPGPEDEVPARRQRRQPTLDDEASGRDGDGVLELGADLRQAARLVGSAPRGDQEGLAQPRARGLDHGRFGYRQGARQLAGPDRGGPGRGGRRDRAELLLPAHGSRRHGFQRRAGQGALLRLHPGRQGRWHASRCGSS